MPTKTYQTALENTQRHHARSKTFSGKFLFRYAERIKTLVDKHDCKTMLDYGCGKGVQYQRPMEDGTMLVDYFGMRGNVSKYDPGLKRFSAMPGGTFDIVICTQVLCWIPVKDIPWVVDLLYERADKVVFVGERIRYPRKTINEEIKEEMPYEWQLDDWITALKRPEIDKPMWLGTDSEFIQVQ